MIRYVVIFLCLLALPTLALTPDERLEDPALEQRAREISKQLRCPVCQNESIDTSNAGLAKDLRRIVRERLKAGDNNQEVIGYIHARYGDYVLMSPPIKPSTALLWLAPFLILIAGGTSVFFMVRKKNG